MTDSVADPPADPAVDGTSDRSVVLRLQGEIDIASEDAWRERGERALADQPNLSELIVDMSEVTFLDSRGLALLVHLYRLLSERDGRLIVAAVPRRVGKALRLAGLDQLFEVHAS